MRKYLAAFIALSLLLTGPALINAKMLEEGEDFETAIEIDVPGEWSGTLDKENEIDFFTFELEHSQIIDIEFSTNAPSTQRLRFYNPTRDEVFRLESSNNAVVSEDYGLAFDTSLDHWYISIEKRLSGSDGDYTFTVSIDHQDDAGSGGDVPDNFDEAFEIEEGEHIGMLKDLDEKDMYKIDVGSSSIVEIEFKSEAPSAQRLRFYDPTRQEVFRLDSSQNVLAEDDYVLAYETSTNHWYISIEKRLSGSDGVYTFTVSIDHQDDAGSGGDVPGTFDEAYEIEEGEHTGMLKDLDERDMYQIEVGSSSIIDIEFKSEAPNDQTLIFYNPNREQLFSLHSSGGSSYNNDYLLAYETETDHWYIEIEKRYGNSDGVYTFTVSIDNQDDAGTDGDVPGTFDEAYEIEEGEYEGVLGDLDIADMYKIYVESGSLIELEFSSESPSIFYGEHQLVLFNNDRSQELSLQSSEGSISRDEHEVSHEMDSDYWYLKVESSWAFAGIHSRTEYKFSVAIEELEVEDDDEIQPPDDDDENDDEDDEYIPYSDVITDGTGDVLQIVGETDEEWTLVENPQIDIVRAEVFESEDLVHVTLTVKGTITDHPDIYYEIFLKDNAGGEYEIFYNDGECDMFAERYYNGGGFVNYFEPQTNGVGTETLTIVFTREQIGNPDVLLISEVITIDESKLEMDMAGPNAMYPPGHPVYDEQFRPVNPILDVIYDPNDFPMEVLIQIGIQNNGEKDGYISMYIDSTLEYTLSVPANDEAHQELTYTFDEAGSYEIEFFDQSHTIVVTDPEDDDGIPEDDDETYTYELTITIEGGGITEPEPGTHTYDEGEDVTVEATPEEGWYFDGWTGIEESLDRKITVSIDQDMTLTANFKEIGEDDIVLTIKVEGEGSTDPETGDHIYGEGEEVTIKAVSDEGWEFEKWRGDYESEEEEITITMDDDKEITAVFAETPPADDDEYDDDEDTPGFTYLALIFSTSSVLIIHKIVKKRRA